MVCYYCSNPTKITNSRKSKKTHETWRRHACTSCGAVFTTREHIDLSTVLRVEDSQKRLQPFSDDKLFTSLHGSLLHRKTALEDARALQHTILQRFAASNLPIIPVAELRETAMEVLNKFDLAAATHYRAFHPKK